MLEQTNTKNVDLIVILSIAISIGPLSDLSAQTGYAQGCANAKQGSSFMEDYMCFPSGGSGSTSPGETKSANINFKAACDIISPALYHPCSWYVNPNGSLTKEGQRAYDCIKNGFGLGVGGLVITEGNIPLVITGLGLLSGFTGCENVVHLELLSGVLDTVGKINSVKSALNIR